MTYSDEYIVPVYKIPYLVIPSDKSYCVENRIMLIGVGRDSTGKLYGATWRVGACRSYVEKSEEIRPELLKTFQP